MAYVKNDPPWVEGGAPGISAERLNHMETQYDEVKGELGNNTGELWTQIKAADGAGSGLDADLLDGLHASDFSRPVLPLIRLVGKWVMPGWIISGVRTYAPVADQLIFIPIWISHQTTFSGIGFGVYSAGAAGTIARLGIYAPNSDRLPGSREADFGTIAVDVTGDRIISISKTLGPGFWYIAYISNGNPTVYTAGINFTDEYLAIPPWTPWDGLNRVARHKRAFCLYVDNQSGVAQNGLPATAPAASSAFTVAPIISLRIA